MFHIHLRSQSTFFELLVPNSITLPFQVIPGLNQGWVMLDMPQLTQNASYPWKKQPIMIQIDRHMTSTGEQALQMFHKGNVGNILLLHWWIILFCCIYEFISFDSIKLKPKKLGFQHFISSALHNHFNIVFAKHVDREKLFNVSAKVCKLSIYTPVLIDLNFTAHFWPFHLCGDPGG